MLKKSILFLLIIIGLIIFVCTIIALKTDEFNTNKQPTTPPQNRSVFVPPQFQTKNNDTEAIAREARSGNTGSFIIKEKNIDNDSIDRSNIFYKLYRFFAFIGYILLSGLVIFYGRF